MGLNERKGGNNEQRAIFIEDIMKKEILFFFLINSLEYYSVFVLFQFQKS